MFKKSKLVMCLGAGAFLMTTSSWAHYVIIEEQAKAAKPWKAEHQAADTSFSNPHVLSIPAFPFLAPTMQFHAIFGWLDAGDYDVYKFSVTSAYEAQTFLSVSMLPPACNETKQHYPIIALVGPAASVQTHIPEGITVPFEVTAGNNIYVAPIAPIPNNVQRPIFTEASTGISWFLPLGLTTECISTNPLSCDYTNTIYLNHYPPYGGTALVNGDYFLVTWDPEGKAQDYTINLGITEGPQNLPGDPVLDLISDNGILHTPCTPPYPGNN